MPKGRGGGMILPRRGLAARCFLVATMASGAGLWLAKPLPIFGQEGEGHSRRGQDAGDGKDLQRVLEALDEKQRGLKDLEADFVQTQVIHLLKEPDVSRGHLYWKDGRLRMDWSEPAPSTLLLDEEGMTLYLPEERKAERYPAREGDDFGALFPGFGQTSDRMRETYDIRLDPDRSDPSAWRLILSPRRERLKRWVRRLTLWVDPEQGVPKAIRLDDPNGKDYTEMRLSKTKVNAGVPDSRFRLDLPKDVEVTEAPAGLPF